MSGWAHKDHSSARAIPITVVTCSVMIQPSVQHMCCIPLVTRAGVALAGPAGVLLTCLWPGHVADSWLPDRFSKLPHCPGPSAACPVDRLITASKAARPSTKQPH